jgi:hypothetical protein
MAVPTKTKAKKPDCGKENASNLGVNGIWAVPSRFLVKNISIPFGDEGEFSRFYKIFILTILLPFVFTRKRMCQLRGLGNEQSHGKLSNFEKRSIPPQYRQ